nr:hypothetical protein [Ningiella sp. W23]
MIHAGELLAIPGEKPQQKQTVVIENGKIVSVSAGFYLSTVLVKMLS